MVNLNNLQTYMYQLYLNNQEYLQFMNFWGFGWFFLQKKLCIFPNILCISSTFETDINVYESLVRFYENIVMQTVEICLYFQAVTFYIVCVRTFFLEFYRYLVFIMLAIGLYYGMVSASVYPSVNYLTSHCGSDKQALIRLGLSNLVHVFP